MSALRFRRDDAAEDRISLEQVLPAWPARENWVAGMPAQPSSTGKIIIFSCPSSIRWQPVRKWEAERSRGDGDVSRTIRPYRIIGSRSDREIRADRSVVARAARPAPAWQSRRNDERRARHWSDRPLRIFQAAAEKPPPPSTILKSTTDAEYPELACHPLAGGFTLLYGNLEAAHTDGPFTNEAGELSL